MQSSDIGIFDTTVGKLEKGIEKTVKMQEIIAHNIANANTPGFVPKKFDEVLNRAVDKIDRSSVNLEEEMADLAKNTTKYSAYIKIMASKFSILRAVVTQGRK